MFNELKEIKKEVFGNIYSRHEDMHKQMNESLSKIHSFEVDTFDDFFQKMEEQERQHKEMKRISNKISADLDDLLASI